MRTHSIHVPHSKLESGAGTVSWNEDEVVTSHGSLSQPGKDKQNYKFLVGKIKSLHGFRFDGEPSQRFVWDPSFPGLGNFCVW